MLNGNWIFSGPKTDITVIISIPWFQAKIFKVKILHKTRTKSANGIMSVEPHKHNQIM